MRQRRQGKVGKSDEGCTTSSGFFATDSDVAGCIRRLMGCLNSDVATVVWNKARAIGVSGGGLVDICFIQESKLSNIDSVNVKSLWGEGDMKWSAKWSMGRSGGIITMWKVGLFEVLFNFVGDCFLGLALNWKGKTVYVVNVYASCFLDKNKEMWKKLRELRAKFQEGEWCIGGDFNVVCDKGERKGIGVQMNGGDIQNFNEFISSMELHDLPVLGNRFTWFNLVGSACSRIDRFLISEGLVNRQVVGERSVSDHFPIRLNGVVKDWGPKPFKLFKCWLNHDGFKPFLEEGWKALSNIRGKPGFVIKEKLSKLKALIRIWNKEVSVLSIP
ncbi:uncharacterized protein LOC131659864 [Vicia villosa]|uniref:uncharacterized protein LOC131659864 n=1 Tax=Vicia villosa TaxID=3911 RepID=UPI00273A92A6|nr:uncharacterized protein LOC131659864 [Vicia villosa]